MSKADTDALVEALAEAIAGPEAWLDSWAQHVGKCKGGYVCTCGLVLARTELSQARARLAEIRAYLENPND
jgi:hypothetical protein